MLDKSIPFYKVIMLREHLNDIPIFALPDGYSFCLFQKGDAPEWAKIETSVGEFANQENALKYFSSEFEPHLAQMLERCVFVCDPNGSKIATATAWFGNHLDNLILPRIHWVAVAPEHQGKGIAKALLAKTLDILRQLESKKPVYLTSQTWSYPAIFLYLNFGFLPIGDPLDSPRITEEFLEHYEVAWQIIHGKLYEKKNL